MNYIIKYLQGTYKDLTRSPKRKNIKLRFKNWVNIINSNYKIPK